MGRAYKPTGVELILVCTIRRVFSVTSFDFLVESLLDFQPRILKKRINNFIESQCKLLTI